MGSDIELTKDQETAKDLIRYWWNNERKEKLVFTLSGYAGTGKTFLINYVVFNELSLARENVVFTAYTGKATSVLIKRGAYGAVTIHKLIYNQKETEYETHINGKTVKSKKMEFVRKPSIDSHIKLIVVDEVSMVAPDILKDLVSFGVPILAVGDSGQLPPINGSSELLDHPDATLSQIVRQSANNAIINIATKVRNRIPIKSGNYGDVIIVNKSTLPEKTLKNLLLKADQVLCGTNRMRTALNDKIKKWLGLNSTTANIGEKVICLQNNWRIWLDKDNMYNLVNGTVGTITEYKPENEAQYLGRLSFKPDFLNEECKDLIIDSKIFEDGTQKYEMHQQFYLMEDGSIEIKTPFMGRQPEEQSAAYYERLKKYVMLQRESLYTDQINFFSPGYAISVHKAQGSEWDNVALFDESRSIRAA